MVFSPREFSEAETKFVPSIHSTYLPKNDNIFEPEVISKARKINQTLKMHTLEKNVVRMVILTSSFSKSPMMKIHFTCGGMGARMKSSVAMLKPWESDDEFGKCQESYNEGEEWLCCLACHQWYHQDCFYE